ncbi:MAG: nitroreductase [Xanthomonadales bacterium]|nr:nitroreductase [Xanthomonadales bacterium]
MEPFAFLLARRSVPARLLAEPGPDEATLARLIALAVRVPDHGALAPWRFLVIRGEARTALGEFLARRRLAIEPAAPAAELEKDRRRLARAPVVVAVVARLRAGERIPEQEQLLSAGLAAYNLLLGAQALGFGGQWTTGWPAYDAEVARHLGLGEGERIVAFVHLGTVREEPPARPRPDPAALCREWRP